jgi:hypothetical protein
VSRRKKKKQKNKKSGKRNDRIKSRVFLSMLRKVKSNEILSQKTKNYNQKENFEIGTMVKQLN